MLADVALEGEDTDRGDRQRSQQTWTPRPRQGSSSAMSTGRVYCEGAPATVRPGYQPLVERSSSRGREATSSPRIAGPRPALTSAMTSGLSKYVVAATIALA